jgi:hypothetical protein
VPLHLAPVSPAHSTLTRTRRLELTRSRLPDFSFTVACFAPGVPPPLPPPLPPPPPGVSLITPRYFRARFMNSGRAAAFMPSNPNPV